MPNSPKPNNVLFTINNDKRKAGNCHILEAPKVGSFASRMKK